MSNKINDEDKVFIKKVYECPVFYVEEQQPTDTSRKRFAVRHPGAAVFLPITDTGSILFVQQYRMPIGRELIEAPAGTLESGELPLHCAQREIQEEVGMRAETWHELGTLYPAPGFCDELQYLFIARDLTPSSLPADADENITVIEMERDEIFMRIASGDICDGKTIALLLRAQLLRLI
ncbi:NUDIX hydrolase [bacterium]|nr:NUDIX hydrolase [bacterium]